MKQSEQDRTLNTTGVPLAIIGIGCLFPKSNSKSAYWATIREGVDAITEIPDTHWQPADLYDPDPKTPDKAYGKRGGFLNQIPFNPMEYNIPPNSLEAIDTSQLLGLVAAGQALKDAGYSPEREFDRSKVSVILGVTGALEMVIPLGARLGHPRWRDALKDAGVDAETAEDVVQRISDSYVGWQENSFPGLLGNVVAGRISKHYDLGGTNCVVDAACASSFSALHLAAMELATGAADLVVSGGVDTFNDIFMYTCFSKTPALSATGNAKPFDSSADGTILGEGLGLVVIKRLADAERDGDRIYAVIRGIGSSSDGKGEAIYTPCPKGQQKAVMNACKNAGVSLDSIGLLEAHGTGTKVGDAVEVSAARELFGESEQPYCAISSVKAQIGHAKAAAGSAGLIKAALALYHRTIPPTIKVTQPLPEVTAGKTPFYITTSKRPWISTKEPRRAGVSAFGFGGSNFHTILEEYRPLQEKADWDGTVQLLPLSASSAGEIRTKLDQLATETDWNIIRATANRLRTDFDNNAHCRLVLVLEQGSDLPGLARNARTMLDKQPEGSWTTPDGTSYATGEATGKLALLFPGQGAQYIGMQRDLACAFPAMLDTLEEAEAVTGGLSNTIYPADAFDAATRDQQESALRDTRMAQPAIGVVSLGALQLLEQFGLQGDAAAGHSYGELTALCAAGILDKTAFHQLSRLRGELMAAGNHDKGTMLAVSAPLATVEQLLQEERLELVLANRNAPSQTVLSGARDQIAKAEEACKQRKTSCKQLQVAAAFHSPLVADAAQPLLAALKKTELGSGRMPVYANSTARPYPSDSNAARELLANQLARPVEFVKQIEAMYADGIRTFVEIGPGARLSGLVEAILGKQEHTCITLDSSNGKRNGLVDLARCLARLATLGYRLELTRWDEDYQPEPEPAKKPLLLVPLCGANYVKPKEKRPPTRPVSAGRPEAVRTETAASSLKQTGRPVSSTSPNSATSWQQNSSTEQISRQGVSLMADQQTMPEQAQLAHQAMLALQKMQAETARLHQRFLEGQESAARTIQAMLGMQAPPATKVQSPLQQGPMQGPVARSYNHDTVPSRPAEPSRTWQETSSTVTSETTPAPTAPTGTASGSHDKIVPVLMEVISDKTGYPVEMLELSMGMDSDLGIDSIKRVEILSALQERLPEAPVIGPEQLGILNTLGEIAEYLGQGTVVATGSNAIAASQPAPTTPAGTASGSHDKIVPVLMEVISDKTGYPVEMLELSMGMDSDLGIDSIKRVEILSALQERLPEAPVIGPEQLGLLNTLGEIAEYLGQGAAPASTATATPAGTASGNNDKIVPVLMEVISDKTGYPVEMLELSMGMDSDLGIDSIKRVEILSALQERLPEAPVIGPEQLGLLNTLGEIAGYLGAAAPLSTEDQAGKGAVPTTVPTVRNQEPAVPLFRSVLMPELLSSAGQKISLQPDGLVVVTDDGSDFSQELCRNLSELGFKVTLTKVMDLLELHPLDQVCGLVLVAPAEGATDRFIKNSFLLLKQLAPGLKRASREGGALFATISRLDGAFGCHEGSSLADPLSGGLAGMAKTARHEWPEVNCKAIDLGDFADQKTAAQAVAKELLKAGPIEVGLSESGRIGLKLQDQPVTDSGTTPVRPGELVIVTGGGRGVTAATAIALARAWHPLLVLLGRSPLPQQEPDWLEGLKEEAEIKRAILTNSKEKLHPREIEEQYQAVISGRELRNTMSEIQAAGGMALYFNVDIRDAEGVSRLVDKLRAEHGPIRGIVHGAGVLADRLIVDKTIEQFSHVYDTKVAGLKSLLKATSVDELLFIALFGSSTARLGRSGQLDYAVANEVLNKLAQAEARNRTTCRTISINWGPWDGGMVTPALKKLFAAEGIGLISLTSGAELLVSELSNQQGAVELTVLAGISPAQLTATEPDRQPQPLKEALRLTLNVDDFPFINSHVIDGRAVLPMAMIVEWLAHAALHGNPGFRFHGFNDLRICKGVTIDRNSNFVLKLMAGKARHQDAFYQVPVELVSQQDDGRSMLHARAEIILANRLPEGLRTIKDLPDQPYQQGSAVYEQPYLFHGPDLHGIEQVTTCSDKGISALVRGAAQPSEWIKSPLRSSWLTDPLAMDSAFQMMILWSFEQSGAGSLPTFAARYRQFQERFPRDGVQINIRIKNLRNNNAVADIEFTERSSSKLVARLEGYECVIDQSLAQAFQRNQLQSDTNSSGAAAA